MQGVNMGDSPNVLRTFTNERSYPFRNPSQMRKFVCAALSHCKTYNDAALVLQCLGSPDTAGRHRLAEICQFPFAVHVSVFSSCVTQLGLTEQFITAGSVHAPVVHLDFQPFTLDCRRAYPEKPARSKGLCVQCCTSSRYQLWSTRS